MASVVAIAQRYKESTPIAIRIIVDKSFVGPLR